MHDGTAIRGRQENPSTHLERCSIQEVKHSVAVEKE